MAIPWEALKCKGYGVFGCDNKVLHGLNCED